MRHYNIAADSKHIKNIKENSTAHTGLAYPDIPTYRHNSLHVYFTHMSQWVKSSAKFDYLVTFVKSLFCVRLKLLKREY